jgi:hypothetical protein
VLVADYLFDKIGRLNDAQAVRLPEYFIIPFVINFFMVIVPAGLTW